METKMEIYQAVSPFNYQSPSFALLDRVIFISKLIKRQACVHVQ